MSVSLFKRFPSFKIVSDLSQNCEVEKTHTHGYRPRSVAWLRKLDILVTFCHFRDMLSSVSRSDIWLFNVYCA